MNRHDTPKKEKKNHPWFCFLSFFSGEFGPFLIRSSWRRSIKRVVERRWVGGENVGGTNQATTTSNIKCVWSGHSAQIKKKKGSAPGVSVRDFFLFFFFPSCCCVCCTRCQPLILWTSKEGGREQISRCGLTSPMGGGQEGGAMHQHTDLTCGFLLLHHFFPNCFAHSHPSQHFLSHTHARVHNT